MNVVTEGVHRRREVHDGVVRAVAWSPDGGHLASAGDDAAIRIWDASNAVEVAPLLGHQGAVGALSWSADGERLASAGFDGTVRVWVPRTGEARPSSFDTWRHFSNWQPVVSIAWAEGNASLFTVNGLGHVYAYSAREGGREVNPFSWETPTIRGLAWSPDGARLACAGNLIFIFDTLSGELSQRILAPSILAPQVVLWHGEGDNVLVGGASGTLALVEVATGKTTSSFQMHEAAVRDVAWHPDGVVFASVGTTAPCDCGI